MNKKFNHYFERGLSIGLTRFIVMLKVHGINLNYGISDFPVSIGYPQKYMRFNKNLLDVCNKITLKQWNYVQC